MFHFNVLILILLTLPSLLSVYYSKMTKEGFQIKVDIISTQTSTRIIYKYTMLENDNEMTYGRFLDIISEPFSSTIGNQFRRLLIDTIRNFPSEAFFFECIPITQSELYSKAMEFVILESKELTTIIVDPSPFKDKFKGLERNQQITSFSNLGGDSLLVVPAPILINTKTNLPDQLYAHLANFIRKGTRIQIELLLLKCGEEIKNILASSKPNEKKWWSTSGLGVSYLHMRIDSVPKYYNYIPYK